MTPSAPDSFLLLQQRWARGWLRLPSPFLQPCHSSVGRRTEWTVVRRAHIRRRHPRRMVREAASRRTSAPTKAPTAASPRVRRTGAASARHIVGATGSLRVCRSQSKAENKNCHRNQLFHLRPFSGAPPPGTPRQARNISSYTKTTQQRENGPSVPWVLTKFRCDSARTRQSLLWCIGCRALTLKKFDSSPCKLLEEFLPHPWESQSALSAGRRLRRTGAATP